MKAKFIQVNIIKRKIVNKDMGYRYGLMDPSMKAFGKTIMRQVMVDLY